MDNSRARKCPECKQILIMRADSSGNGVPLTCQCPFCGADLQQSPPKTISVPAIKNDDKSYKKSDWYKQERRRTFWRAVKTCIAVCAIVGILVGGFYSLSKTPMATNNIEDASIHTEYPTDNTEIRPGNFDWQLTQIFVQCKENPGVERLMTEYLDGSGLKYTTVRYTSEGYYTTNFLDTPVTTQEEAKVSGELIQKGLIEYLQKNGANISLKVTTQYLYRTLY